MKAELDRLLQQQKEQEEDAKHLRLKIAKLQDGLVRASRQLDMAIAGMAERDKKIQNIRHLMWRAGRRSGPLLPGTQPQPSNPSYQISVKPVIPKLVLARPRHASTPFSWYQVVEGVEARRAAKRTRTASVSLHCEDQGCRVAEPVDGKVEVGVEENVEENVKESKEKNVKENMEESVAENVEGELEVVAEVKRKLLVKERARLTPRVVKEEVFEMFPCNLCVSVKTFSSAATLVAHLASHSQEAVPRLACPFTSCRYKGAVEAMVRHVRSLHTAEKLFQCQVCAKEMPSFDSLQKHENNHEDPNFVFCASCLGFFKSGTRCSKATCK